MILPILKLLLFVIYSFIGVSSINDIDSSNEVEALDVPTAYLVSYTGGYISVDLSEFPPIGYFYFTTDAFMCGCPSSGTPLLYEPVLEFTITSAITTHYLCRGFSSFADTGDTLYLSFVLDLKQAVPQYSTSIISYVGAHTKIDSDALAFDAKIYYSADKCATDAMSSSFTIPIYGDVVEFDFTQAVPGNYSLCFSASLDVQQTNTTYFSLTDLFIYEAPGALVSLYTRDQSVVLWDPTSLLLSPTPFGYFIPDIYKCDSVSEFGTVDTTQSSSLYISGKNAGYYQFCASVDSTVPTLSASRIPTIGVQLFDVPANATYILSNDSELLIDVTSLVTNTSAYIYFTSTQDCATNSLGLAPVQVQQVGSTYQVSFSVPASSNITSGIYKMCISTSTTISANNLYLNPISLYVPTSVFQNTNALVATGVLKSLVIDMDYIPIDTVYASWTLSTNSDCATGSDIGVLPLDPIDGFLNITTNATAGEYNLCLSMINSPGQYDTVKMNGIKLTVFDEVPSISVVVYNNTYTEFSFPAFDLSFFFYWTETNDCSTAAASYTVKQIDQNTNTLRWDNIYTSTINDTLYLCISKVDTPSAEDAILINTAKIITNKEYSVNMPTNINGYYGGVLQLSDHGIDPILKYYYSQDGCLTIDTAIGLKEVTSTITLDYSALDLGNYNMCITLDNDPHYYNATKIYADMNIRPNLNYTSMAILNDRAVNLGFDGVQCYESMYFVDSPTNTCGSTTTKNPNVYTKSQMRSLTMYGDPFGNGTVFEAGSYSICLSTNDEVTNHDMLLKDIVITVFDPVELNPSQIRPKTSITLPKLTPALDLFYYFVDGNGSCDTCEIIFGPFTMSTLPDSGSTTTITNAGSYKVCLGQTDGDDFSLGVLTVVESLDDHVYNVFSNGTFSIDFSNVNQYSYWVNSSETSCNATILNNEFAVSGAPHTYTTPLPEGSYILCTANTDSTSDLDLNTLFPNVKLNVVNSIYDNTTLNTYANSIAPIDIENLLPEGYYYWVESTADSCYGSVPLFPILHLNEETPNPVMLNLTGITTLNTYSLCYSYDDVQSFESDTKIDGIKLRINPEIPQQTTTTVVGNSTTVTLSNIATGSILYYINSTETVCGNRVSFIPQVTVNTTNEFQVTYDLTNAEIGTYTMCIFTHTSIWVSSINDIHPSTYEFSEYDTIVPSVKLIVKPLSVEEPDDETWAHKYWYVIFILCLAFVSAIAVGFYLLKKNKITCARRNIFNKEEASYKIDTTVHVTSNRIHNTQLNDSSYNTNHVEIAVNK